MAHFSGEMGREGGVAGGPEAGGALPNDGAGDGRHPGGRGAGARRVGEDVEMRQAALGDEVEGADELRLGLGGEARDQVGPEDGAGS